MAILSIAVESHVVKYGVYDSGKEILKEKIDHIADLESENRSIGAVFKTINDSIKKQKADIKIVVHKLIHGGNSPFCTTADKKTMEELEKLSDFPILYNPDQVEMIDLSLRAFPNSKQVICFDNGFYEMDDPTSLYAMDLTNAQNYKIKRYGYDSINHLYAATAASEIQKKKLKQEKVISCYLGFSSSVCAVQDEKGIDTTSGFTKLEGIPGFSSSGSIDPSILTLLMDEELHTTDEILNILKAQSGLSAIAQIEKMSELLKSKDKKAKLAFSVLAKNAIKAIGSMAAVLNGPTTLVFSGELVEQNSALRDEICVNLEYLGIKLDKKKNAKSEEIISDSKSKVKVINIMENELLMMSRLASGLFKK